MDGGPTCRERGCLRKRFWMVAEAITYHSVPISYIPKSTYLKEPRLLQKPDGRTSSSLDSRCGFQFLPQTNLGVEGSLAPLVSGVACSSLNGHNVKDELPLHRAIAIDSALDIHIRARNHGADADH